MSPMEEKKLKRSIDESIAESINDIQAKHPEIKVTFDWDTYDGLDWAGLGKSKDDEIKYLAGHFKTLGYGFNFACKDEDYKEELVKVSEIIVKPATDASPSSKAVGSLSGDKLTIVFHSLGGTMGADDWEKGLKSAY
jgi:hypothetical protein